MENKYCNIYIDEAGDLGVNRGTRWFVLTAVIVNKDDEKELRGIVDGIRTRLNVKELHFRHVNSFDKKCFVVNEIDKGTFQYINVIIDTTKIDLAKIGVGGEKPSIVLYNYACRFLLERVSWLLRDTNRVGTIILSSRGTSRDQELINYIQHKLLPYPDNSIENRFIGVTSKSSNEWDMLQLADVCATSMFYSFEVNAFGFITPCFTRKIKEHLYSYGNEVNKYGIKFFNEGMRPAKGYFDGKIICE